MKKTLFIIFGVIALLILILVFKFIGACRDIAPPEVSDLVPDRVDVADSDNAYTYFNKALLAADWPESDELLHDILEGKKSDPAYVAQLLSRNQETFQFLDRGLECRVCQMPAVKTIEDTCGYIPQWRTLSRLLWLKATHAREAGQWTESADACGKLLQLGNLVQKNTGCMVNYLVAIAILDQGFDATCKLAASPEVSEDALARLAKALDRVGPFKQGLVHTIKSEYQIISNTIDGLIEGTVSLGDDDTDAESYRHASYLFQPNKTKQMFADEYRQLLSILELPIEDREVEMIHSPPDEGAKRLAWSLGPNGMGKIMVTMMTPCLDAVFQAQCRCKGALAAARLVVACRRYEKDHGQLPPTLDALVPKYLAAVPVDPYDGRPMRYDAKRAIVYSIGKDLADSGGSDKTPTGESPGDENFDRWDVEDDVFYIHGQPKASEPVETP